MKTYLLTACGIIFLAVIVGLIVPNGKLKKSVNFVLRLICIFILIQPITQIFKFSDGEKGEVINYEYVSQVYAQNQSKLLTEKVESELNIACVCIVEVVYDGTQIKEQGVVCSGSFDDEKTISILTEYLRELGYINISVNDKAY